MRCNGTTAVLADIVQVFNPLAVWIVRAAVATHLSYNSDGRLSFIVWNWGQRSKCFVCLFLILKNISKNQFWLQFLVADLAFLSKNPFRMTLCHVLKIPNRYILRRHRGKCSCSERKRRSWRLPFSDGFVSKWRFWKWSWKMESNNQFVSNGQINTHKTVQENPH